MNNKLSDEIRSIAKHTNRDNVETLRAKLEQLETMERDSRISHRVDAEARSMIVRSQAHLRTRIYHVLTNTRGEWW